MSMSQVVHEAQHHARGVAGAIAEDRFGRSGSEVPEQSRAEEDPSQDLAYHLGLAQAPEELSE
jgi:hypothetical protein